MSEKHLQFTSTEIINSIIANMEKQKDLDYRVKELERGLRALRFASADFLKNHDDAYLLTVQAQLRALVISGGDSMTPLLLDLSHKCNVPLYLYANPKLISVQKHGSKNRKAAILSSQAKEIA